MQSPDGSEEIVSIKQLWENFYKEAMPSSVSELQVRETEKSFYAGAIGMFVMLTGIEDAHGANKHAIDLLGALSAECEVYIKDRLHDQEQRAELMGASLSTEH